MSGLEIIIIVVGVIFILFALDLYQRKKFTLLHFLVFGGGVGAIILFSLFPDLLTRFGNFFGLARGADLIVYLSIIFLGYGYIELMNRQTKRDEESTRLARYFSLSQAKGDISGVKIIFIIPAYNEDVTILETVNSVIDAGYHAIIIDDGKNKINLYSSFRRHLDQGKIVLISHPSNLGQGASLQTGAEWVINNSPETEFVVHFDADGQHDIKDIENFIAAFKQDSTREVVLGSRALGGVTGITLGRRLHKKLQVLFMKLFVGVSLTDTNNGYRMIKTSVLPKLTIRSNRMAHASEIESMIHQKDIAYAEVPVTIAYTEYSMQKGQDLSNAFSIVRELFYKRWFYK